MPEGSQFVEALHSRRATDRFIRFAEWLEESGYNLDDLMDQGRLDRIEIEGGTWDTTVNQKTVDPDTGQLVSEIQTVPNEREQFRVVLSPQWSQEPKWPVIQPVTVKLPKRKKRLSANRNLDGWTTTLICPDTQIGYFHDEDGNLHPLHDERVLDIFLQLIREVQPMRIVHLGDVGDFTLWSDKYVQSPAFANTTQLALSRIARLFGEWRDAAPGARIDVLEGNHDNRPGKLITKNALEAYDLKRPGEDWPVWTLPALCDFESLDIHYHPGDPGNEVWLNPRLRCRHSPKHGDNAARNYLKESPYVSTIFGHGHRYVFETRTFDGEYGSQLQSLAVCPGTASRVDGVVPSARGGFDPRSGVPASHRLDWQQGICIAYSHEDGRHGVDVVACHGTEQGVRDDGGRISDDVGSMAESAALDLQSFYHGQRLISRVDINGEAIVLDDEPSAA